MFYLELFGIVVEGKLQDLAHVLEGDHGGQLPLADLDQALHEQLVRRDQDVADELNVVASLNRGGFVAVDVFNDDMQDLCRHWQGEGLSLLGLNPAESEHAPEVLQPGRQDAPVCPDLTPVLCLDDDIVQLREALPREVGLGPRGTLHTVLQLDHVPLHPEVVQGFDEAKDLQGPGGFLQRPHGIRRLLPVTTPVASRRAFVRPFALRVFIVRLLFVVVTAAVVVCFVDLEGGDLVRIPAGNVLVA